MKKSNNRIKKLNKKNNSIKIITNKKFMQSDPYVFESLKN